jgi:uncharacterized protein (TIGR02145 family)
MKQKTNNIIYLFPLAVLFSGIIISCSKFEPIPPENESSWVEATVPKMTAGQATDITDTGAKVKIVLVSTGGRKVRKISFCYSSTSTNPDTLDKVIELGSANIAGEYLVTLKELKYNTKYYYRVIGRNMNWIFWSTPQSFTTLNDKRPAVVSTGDPSQVTFNSASLGGNIVFTGDGSATVTQHGHVWSTQKNPTITDNKTQLGNKGTGVFTSNMTNLIKSTKYYYSAYATNSFATTYGDVKEFYTNGNPSVLTNDIIVTRNTASTCGGEVVYDGGSQVTERGVCWGTSPNPTTADSKTSDGNGTGKYSSSITGLKELSTYYVRAYAVNKEGTGYGEQKTFIAGRVMDADGNSYNIVKVESQYWLKENLKTTKFNDGTAISLVTDNVGWGSLTSGGYCYYNNESGNKNIYGALYNWHVVNDNRLVCPPGWEVPSDDDWNTLLTALYYQGFGPLTAGGPLKHAGTNLWGSPNTGATDKYGFSAFPGGGRYNDGVFSGIKAQGVWWSSTEANSSGAWARYMYYNNSKLDRIESLKRIGFSIRCISK